MKKYLVVIVLLSILQLEAAHNRYTGNILVPDKFGDLLLIKPQNFLNDPAHYVDQLPLKSVLALAESTNRLYLRGERGGFSLHEVIPGNLELLLALRGDIGFTSLLTRDSLSRLNDAIAFLELETAKKLIQELKRQDVKRFVPSGYR